MDSDTLVIGAGPAGLSAATELRRLGVAHVTVVDREAEAGGIPRHGGHYPYGLREFRTLMKGPAYARALRDRALAAGVTIRTGITVTALHPGGRISVTSDDGMGQMSAARVLLAMGARETPRATRLIGGVKPGGILSTGALQGLVYLNGQRPFRRPVILGTELVAFSAILTCRHLGITPVAMIEPGARTTARWPTALFPRMLGIPLHLRTDLLSIEGADRVTGVTVQGPDGQTRQIACDGVIVTGGFRPESALLAGGPIAIDPATGGPLIDSTGRCSDPAYFAAGNLLRGIETAGACWDEGRRIGGAIARSLKGQTPHAALSVTTVGEALKYVLPQSVAPDRALSRFQLRVTRPVQGNLVVKLNGREVARHPISARPERRITVPFSVLPKGATGTLTFEIEEPGK